MPTVKYILYHYYWLLVVLCITGCATLSSMTVPSPGGSSSDDTFLTSDDYRDGEEIVGVFLTDAEYARMVEDFEYRDVDFDWGWAKGEMSGEIVRSLAFDVRDYGTVRVAATENHSNALDPDIASEVHQRFTAAMERLGLQVVSGAADLELGTVIVDYKSDKTFIWFANIDPFIELELRLRDLATAESLLLIRDQEHGTTPADAAGDFAGAVLQILR